MKIHQKHLPGCPCYVEYWYDPHLQAWTITVRDIAGNQIGEANHAATKTGRDSYVRTALGTIQKLKAEAEAVTNEAHGISGGEHDCVKQAIAEHLGMEDPE